MNELSRKRPHTDDGDITVAKKCVLTGTNGTPHVNGHSDQTEDEQLFQANLEVSYSSFKGFTHPLAHTERFRNSERRPSIEE